MIDQIVDPANAPLETLPKGGTYLVTTNHSTYVIDTDAGTFERYNIAGNNPFDHLDGVPLRYHHIECDVDASMVIKTDHARDGWLRTTRVVGIDPWTFA